MSGVPGPAPSEFDFHTERLHLRPLDERDEALFHALYTDPDTMRFIAPPRSVVQATSSFQKVVAGQREQSIEKRFLAILDKATLQPMGICGTSKYDAEAKRLEVGIVLKREARSRGFAQEVLRAFMKRIFAVSPTQEICVKFSAFHPVMERLSIRVGFTPCVVGVFEKGGVSKRVWSVYRSSWYVNQAGH